MWGNCTPCASAELDVQSGCDHPVIVYWREKAGGSHSQNRCMLDPRLHCDSRTGPCRLKPRSFHGSSWSGRHSGHGCRWVFYLCNPGRSADHPTLAIQSETGSVPKAAPEKMGIKVDHAFGRVWGPARRDFAQQDRQPRGLLPDIPIQAPYELLPPAQARLRPYYADSFSAVGFGPRRKHAIVSIIHSCGGFAAVANLALSRRQMASGERFASMRN